MPIQPQYENKLMSSALLWMDNVLCRKGQAFINNSGYLYRISGKQGYITYATPFKPLVADVSVANSGADLLTGVYLNNVFVSTGTSGLYAINHELGQAYFTGAPLASTVTVSGRYSIKEFSLALTDEPEEKLLFETKYELRPKTVQTLTGLQSNEYTYPAIYVKNFGGDNEPWTFGGMDCTKTEVRAIVLADSQFALDAVCSLFKDQVRSTIALIPYSEMPFNSLGEYVNGVKFNYTGIAYDKVRQHNSAFVERVSVSTLSYGSYNQIKNLNPKIYPGIIDIEFKSYRVPRTQ